MKSGRSDHCTDSVRSYGSSLHFLVWQVLDPEQNAAFVDTYLGVPFDLSKVRAPHTCILVNAFAVPEAGSGRPMWCF